MGVLNIKYRVVPGLFDHLGEIEIERGVILAEQHYEAHRSRSDFVDHLSQGDEGPRALRHLHRLTGAEQPHELADLDVQIGGAAAQSRDRRLQPFDITCVVGAEDIDHMVKAAP